jgi:hypothetical protein
MIAFLLRTVLLLASTLILSGVAGVTVFLLVFFLPTLIGQPEDSMLAWGWVTTVPAFILGWGVGIATFMILIRRLVAWRILASPHAPFDCKRPTRTFIFVATSLAIGAVFVVLPPIRDLAPELW